MRPLSRGLVASRSALRLPILSQTSPLQPSLVCRQARVAAFRQVTTAQSSRSLRLPARNSVPNRRWAHTGSPKRTHIKFVKPSFFTGRRISIFLLKLVGAVYIIGFFTSGAAGPIKIQVNYVDEEEGTGEGDEDPSAALDQLPGQYRRGERRVGSVQFGGDEGDQDDGDEDEDDEDEDPGELISFVVLSIPKQLPREYYSSADPEWQEFAKLSKDPQRLKNLKLGLANLLRTTIAKDARLPALGEVKLGTGRSWLEIVFPYGPPPVYEVSGIGIYENQVVIGTSTITEEQYSRLKHMFLPIGVVVGSYQLVRGIFLTQYQKFKTMITGQPEMQTGSIPFPAAGTTPRLPNSSRPSSSSSTSPSPSTATPTSPPTTTTSQTSPPAQSGSTTIGGQGASSSSSSSSSSTTTPPVFTGGMEILLNSVGHARAAYKPKEPPRGACVLTGKVEVIGSDAWSMLDVLALYDPAKDTFLHVDANVRVVQPHVMWARGDRK